jgi:cobalt-zinc-cadmium efflux system membrane fusion protein
MSAVDHDAYHLHWLFARMTMSPSKFVACGMAWLGLLAAQGCNSADGKPSAAHDKPAKVEKLPVETELAVVTLTEDAERRLGIETVAVLEQAVAPRRTLGGEAIVPTGRTIVVSAPVAGMVARPADKPIALPGARVDQGEAVLSLVPMLSPERDVPTPAEQVQLVNARATLLAAQMVALGDVDRSKAEVEAATIILERSQNLFKDRAGPRRDMEDAEAQLHIAESVLEAANQRAQQLTDLLEMLKQPGSDGIADALPMTTPISGILNRLAVSPGQTVANGAALFEVVNLDTIWVRVPIFVDLLATIETEQTAYLVSLSGDALGASPSTAAIEATPIAAPPSANATSSSADLYFEVDNRQLGLRPGQRVGVQLPLKGAQTALTVPDSAILFDIYGGAWVYVASGDRHYTRHRVSIRWSDGEQAILAAGPDVGSQVVVAGAAELFGTEFGSGK